MSLTISDQVAAMTAARRAKPDPSRDAFAAERDRLARIGTPAGAAEVGSVMPDGDLIDVHGARTTLTAARDGKPAVVVFYRGAWCPFCNIALRTYEQQLAVPLAERGILLAALSPQKPDGALTMQEKNDLTYTVLSDPGNQIASALGILSPQRSPEVRAASAGNGSGVADSNADGTDTVPMPTTVIVAADGTIAWIDVHPDYSTRSEPDQILAALADLGL